MDQIDSSSNTATIEIPNHKCSPVHRHPFLFTSVPRAWTDVKHKNTRKEPPHVFPCEKHIDRQTYSCIAMLDCKFCMCRYWWCRNAEQENSLPDISLWEHETGTLPLRTPSTHHLVRKTEVLRKTLPRAKGAMLWRCRSTRFKWFCHDVDDNRINQHWSKHHRQWERDSEPNCMHTSYILIETLWWLDGSGNWSNVLGPLVEEREHVRGFADVVHSVLVSFSPMPFTGWVSLTYSITRSLTPFDIWMSLMQVRCFLHCQLLHDMKVLMFKLYTLFACALQRSLSGEQVLIWLD